VVLSVKKTVAQEETVSVAKAETLELVRFDEVQRAHADPRRQKVVEFEAEGVVVGRILSVGLPAII
jgi:hypothetical protein